MNNWAIVVTKSKGGVIEEVGIAKDIDEKVRMSRRTLLYMQRDFSPCTRKARMTLLKMVIHANRGMGKSVLT